MKKLILIFALLFSAAGFFAAVPQTQAVGLQNAQGQLERAAKDPFNVSTGENVSLVQTIGRIIGIALALVGTIFLVLMVYGGYLWMTARGDAEQLKNAQTNIRNAIIGLIIVVAGYAISQFIVEALVATALE